MVKGPSLEATSERLAAPKAAQRVENLWNFVVVYIAYLTVQKHL